MSPASEPPLKRRKVSSHPLAANGETVKRGQEREKEVTGTETHLSVTSSSLASPLRSLVRGISPPVRVGGKGAGAASAAAPAGARNRAGDGDGDGDATSRPSVTAIPSPIQLTRVRNLPARWNRGAVGVRDVLGDPLIRECWQFNYLFDVGFVVSALDPDVRGLVRVKIVHGSWRKEDPHRVELENDAKAYPNVELIRAYMPEPFGTHHSKMMVLLRHDDTAQVVIHTANMIERDWTSMTQGIWRSPLLPLLRQPTLPSSAPPNTAAAAATSASQQPSPPPSSSAPHSNRRSEPAHPIGSGPRFKVDLLRYLRAYGSRLKPLVRQLKAYDFSAVRGAFIASTPGRQAIDGPPSPAHTRWGWLGLRQVLSQIPIQPSPAASVAMQVSSIATLGATDAWLRHFLGVLATTSSASSPSPSCAPSTPTPHLIFPSARTIRNSLDGYASGASVHLKLQRPAQQKQLNYLRPLLRHWDGGGKSRMREGPHDPAADDRTRAGRAAAAPHIKTYIRYRGDIGSGGNGGGRKPEDEPEPPDIDWALLTSANLSTQAWGALPGRGDGARTVRICSWEVGVLVWPELFRSEQKQGQEEVMVRMVPVFGRDEPDEVVRTSVAAKEEGEEEGGGEERTGAGQHRRRKEIRVGFRMPYDVPLVPYGPGEQPWCATMAYDEPDWKGQVWTGY